MTNTHAQSKKRHWRSGSGGAFRFVSARDPMAFLSKYRSGFARAGASAAAGGAHTSGSVSHQTVLSMDALLELAALSSSANGSDIDCNVHSALLLQLMAPPKPSLVHALPQELLELVLSALDGDSLLACSLVCRALAPLTHNRDVWRNICMQRWPTLQTQFLPQLPGAPDYDVRCALGRTIFRAMKIFSLTRMYRDPSSSFACMAGAGVAALSSSTASASAQS